MPCLGQVLSGGSLGEGMSTCVCRHISAKCMKSWIPSFKLYFCIGKGGHLELKRITNIPEAVRGGGSSAVSSRDSNSLPRRFGSRVFGFALTRKSLRQLVVFS